MAGDHKCPVCQSTFTRPQHVARHMRSHTGDRPYKCQHCGDQFARSDLLSRHVNKCHASEKPPTATSSNRRKGTAVASRATTSKQACDQCVQSSLPCDGANPCSKCIQRKCRCTYVKFHRQTAPQGPGHPVPSTSGAISGQDNPTLPPRLPDDFMLAPPLPSAAFTFPSVYPSEYLTYQHPTHTYGARESPSPSLTLSGSARESLDPSPDLMARYRAQAELLSRAGVLSDSSIAMGSQAAHAPAPAGIDTLPGMYGSQGNVHYGRYALPVAAPGWPAQPYHVEDKSHYESPPPHAQQHPQHPQHPQQSFRDCADPLPAHPPAHAAHTHASAPGFPGVAGIEGFAGHPAFRRAPKDEFGEGSDGGYTNSMPNSRNSSSLHLPLPEHAHGPPPGQHQHQHQQHGQHPHPLHPHQQRYEEYQPHGRQPEGQGEGGFSSAFGLMSLDDPNVLAGLSSDSSPFFTSLSGGQNGGGSSSNANGGFSGAMHTSDMLAALKGVSTGGREESKEMRDFWKMYMRTPLSGPGNATSVMSLSTPTGAGGMLGAGSEASRRHSRVASLPSLRTPPLLADAAHANAGGYAHRAEDAGGSSALRTVLHAHGHGEEDLKSYEQAVLARSTPMTFNLVMKRKPTAGAQANAPSSLAGVSGFAMGGRSVSAGAGTGTGAPQPFAPQVNRLQDLLNRPESASTDAGEVASASLVHAFMRDAERVQDMHAYAMGSHMQGQAQQQQQQQPQPQMRAPSSEAESDGSQACAGYRPSFKRLASQTLGPERSKRALLGPAGWDDGDGDDGGDVEEDEEEEDDEDDRGSSGQKRFGSAGAKMRRPMVKLSERRRRMSCPTGAGGGQQQQQQRVEAAAASAAYP